MSSPGTLSPASALSTDSRNNAITSGSDVFSFNIATAGNNTTLFGGSS